MTVRKAGNHALVVDSQLNRSSIGDLRGKGPAILREAAKRFVECQDAVWQHVKLRMPARLPIDLRIVDVKVGADLVNIRLQASQGDRRYDFAVDVKGDEIGTLVDYMHRPYQKAAVTFG